jgi:broad specificity phosphatase PhoE
VRDERLREINFGHFEGVTRQELTPELVTEWDAWWKDPFGLRVTGGESMTDLAERVQAWLDELPAEGRFAAVTHGGVIRCMLWKITGAPPEGRWSVQLDNTSLTKVRLTEKRTIILCVNDSSHLS